ncbi:hypothetical protein HMPREF1548_03075 [Clostridium sp. KLE 1755]|nr:hypothetical protein HMPREF1548_03075 [Clostridium sp. KLE 1755]
MVIIHQVALIQHKLIIWQKIFGNIMDTLEQQITISFSMV